jgi:hypothetical protein
VLALLEWLLAAGCTHGAMEATGVYWNPLYNLLDGQVEVLVVTAQHSTQVPVPGRKTDGNEAAWIAGCGTVSVLRGDGHGRFEAAASYPVGTHPQSIAVGDLNGDGTLIS